MIFPQKKIRTRLPNKLATTTYANEIADVVNASGAGYALSDARPANAPGVVFICKIVDTGPNGETDPDDETYWAQIQYVIGGSDPTDPIDTDDDQTLDSDTVADSILLVTNEAEQLPDSDPGDGPHLLRVGTLIEVRGEEDDDGIVRYVTNTPVGATYVRLSNPDGDYGSVAGAADLTYSIEDVNGTNIADDVEVDYSRPVYKVLAGTVGFAQRIDGTWKLLWTDEQPDLLQTPIVTGTVCNGDGTITVDSEDSAIFK